MISMTEALVDLFRERAPIAGGAGLEAVLRELLARGQGRWPALAVDPAAFMRHLAERAPPDGPPESTLPGLLIEDLYLCCACLEGVPGALLAFEQGFLTQVPAYVCHLDPSPSFADEVRQVLRERIFTAPRGGRAKLLDYSGRGPLQRWVRVAALRTGLTQLRQRGRQQLREDEFGTLGADQLAEQHLSPEMRHLRGRYAELFQECVREAVGKLDGEQRALLRIYWVGGQSTEKIAAIYRVNRSTVSRWLVATRELILDETRRLLCQRTGVSPSEFRSLARDLHADLDLSLSSLLKQSTP